MNPFALSRRDALKAVSLLGVAGATGSLFPIYAHAQDAPTTMTETRTLMGTLVSVSLAHPSRQKMSEGLEQVFSHLETLAALHTRHDPAAPLGVLNSQGSLRDVPPELTALLHRARLVHRLTDGAFDITVQPLVDLLRQHKNPKGPMTIVAADLAQAKLLMGMEYMDITEQGIALHREGMGLTLDGIAKGHIADEASLMLTSLGLPNHLVNAGGDMVAYGEKAPDTPWMVAVAHPQDPNRPLSPAFALRCAALATSGGGQLYFDKNRQYNHLIQPDTGHSPQDVLSVSVRAKTGLEADALATAMAVMPPQAALALVDSLSGRSCLLVMADGRTVTSRNWTI